MLIMQPSKVLISIHTPHAGSDYQTLTVQSADSYFNPHSPCGERLENEPDLLPNYPFQSTLPMRGATAMVLNQRVIAMISIHTPHAGSDHLRHLQQHRQHKFQSTLPMRGATPAGCVLFGYSSISIHTPHAGSD